MKEAIKEYLLLTDVEKQHLWNNATFVFDTNVLLDLYRYSKDTREKLLGAITKLKGRIFMPYHVACEFMKNRCNVIIEMKIKYEHIRKDATKYIDSICDKLKLSNDEKDIKALSKYLLKWVENKADKDLSTNHPTKDPVLDSVLKTFDGIVGVKYKKNEYKEFCEKAEERFSDRIPPGYKDKGKGNNNEYGDYIIWTQILDFAHDNQKDIIFITSDG